MDWRERLQAAETEDDFNAVKDDIDSHSHYTLMSITSPCVLRAYLRSREWEEDYFQGAFYMVSGASRRVDLMRVLVPEFITLEDLTRDKEKTSTFYGLVAATAREGRVDVMSFFLNEMGVKPEFGVDLDFTKPLLTVACYWGKVDIIDLLFEKEADANVQMSCGTVPAYDAMWTPDVNVLNRLIIHGADLRHRNKDGDNLWNAVHVLCYKEGLQENFQALANMDVYLDEDVFERWMNLLSPHRREHQGLRRILQEVMEKQRKREERR